MSQLSCNRVSAGQQETEVPDFERGSWRKNLLFLHRGTFQIRGRRFVTLCPGAVNTESAFCHRHFRAFRTRPLRYLTRSAAPPIVLLSMATPLVVIIKRYASVAFYRNRYAPILCLIINANKMPSIAEDAKVRCTENSMPFLQRICQERGILRNVRIFVELRNLYEMCEGK